MHVNAGLPTAWHACMQYQEMYVLVKDQSDTVQKKDQSDTSHLYRPPAVRT